MGRVRYDLVFGLGNACSCTETIRRAGLQFLSFPFDWVTDVFTKAEDAEHELLPRVRTLCNGFSKGFGKADFTFFHSLPSIGKDAYVNRVLNLIFNHDFPMGVPYDQAYEIVGTRYRRRADRLLTLIRSSKRVLVVRMDRPNQLVPTTIEDCRQARLELEQAFAPVKFDFVLFSYDKGRSFGRRIEETIDEGFVRIVFDYRNYAGPEYQVAVSKTGSILARKFAVTDYRTPEERRRHDERLRQKRRIRRQRFLARLSAWLHFLRKSRKN